MKNKFLIYLLFFASINSAEAIDQSQPSGVYVVDILIYRPMGLVTTLAGTAFFIGASPLTALAAISPPHDAFDKLSELLIMKPARFTFDRPLGVYFADSDGKYRRHQ